MNVAGENGLNGPDGAKALKNAAFGRYQSHEDKCNALGLRAAAKALDMPLDEMNVTSTTTTNNHYQAAAAGRVIESHQWLLAAAAAIVLAAGGAGILGLGRRDRRGDWGARQPIQSDRNAAASHVARPGRRVEQPLPKLKPQEPRKS
jgi:hypothetical protein